MAIYLDSSARRDVTRSGNERAVSHQSQVYAEYLKSTGLKRIAVYPGIPGSNSFRLLSEVRLFEAVLSARYRHFTDVNYWRELRQRVKDAGYRLQQWAPEVKQEEA